MPIIAQADNGVQRLTILDEDGQRIAVREKLVHGRWQERGRALCPLSPETRRQYLPRGLAAAKTTNGQEWLVVWLARLLGGGNL